MLTLALYLIGCGASKKSVSTPIATQADVDRVQTKFPGYSLVELNEGRTLFEKHCGNCHGLKRPDSQSEENWQKIVPRMAKKVNKKEGNVLDSRGEDLILKYVITMGPALSAK